MMKDIKKAMTARKMPVRIPKSVTFSKHMIEDESDIEISSNEMLKERNFMLKKEKQEMKHRNEQFKHAVSTLQKERSILKNQLIHQKREARIRKILWTEKKS